jgi:glycosyltransferase involved in cell wall biosynthesis
MIVKNEEKYIKMCLENAMKLADEAIIVDTGSTDRTKEIIKEFDGNIKIIDYKWEEDFSKARNISLEAATGDWILMLDADEKLLCDDKQVREILKNAETEGYRMSLYNIINTNSILFSSVYLKIFKNHKGYKYSGRIHEQLSLPKMNMEKSSIDSSICKIIHYGYLANVMKDRNKIQRNLDILKKQLQENPDDPFVCYNIGVAYELNQDYEKALKYFFKSNDRLKKVDPTGLDLYEIDMARRICECLVILKKYDECINLVDNLLSDKNFEGFVDLVYISGYCHFVQKKYMKAIEIFNNCISIGDTTKFMSILGMGSFKAKFMMARCYVELKEELKAINSFMESIFDSNNFLHEGIDEFRKYLIITNRNEILDGLNKLVK